MADDIPDLVLIAIRTVHLAATVSIAGVVIFRFVVAEPAFLMSGAPQGVRTGLRAQFAVIASTGLAVAIVSGAAWLTWLTADISGHALGDVLASGALAMVVAQTQFGQVFSARLAIAVLLGGLLVVERHAGSDSRWRSGAMLVLAAALLAAMALAGHAGATPAPGGFVHAASDAMHLIAAGTWVGGLLPLALMLGFGRPAGDEIGIDVAATAARRFSTIGMLSVGTLAASGALDTWFLIGNLSDLAATDYGRLLSLKITLFIAMLCIATVNRFWLVPRLHDADKVRQVRRNSLIEAAIGLLLIAIVGALGMLAPVPHVHAH